MVERPFRVHDPVVLNAFGRRIEGVVDALLSGGDILVILPDDRTIPRITVNSVRVARRNEAAEP